MSLSLNCSVCHLQLVDPVTLSCGYTVCLSCLPSQEEFRKSTFVCPVKQCNNATHLFGPNLYLDNVLQVIVKNKDTQSIQDMQNTLQCSIGNHLLNHPVTTHCGHSFCKLCLLQYKISNDSCKQCQKRLPSYQFIQHQSPNLLLESILSFYCQRISLAQDEISALNHVGNQTISFNPLRDPIMQAVPIYLTEFPVLPSQKLRIPIYTEQHRIFFLNSILICKEYQSLCFGVMSKDKANHKGRFGTIVKINSIEQRQNDMIIDVIGMDRFQATSILKETDDFLQVDLCMKFESSSDLAVSNRHWTDHRLEKQAPPPPPNKYSETLSTPPSPDSPMEGIMISTATPPSSPPAEEAFQPSSTAILLSNRVHDFISDLAHSTPSTSFCSTLEGLLGPVWLNSVQGLHGSLPPADNAVAMCWWAAVVMPVSNTERYHLLSTESLEKRLDIILSWINDLKSQWGNCRRTAINTAAKVGN